jgi:circadian clock protein KaiC
VPFRGGFHDMTIRKSGVVVFPRLVAAEHLRRAGHEPMSSGLSALDALVGGNGLERGTSVLLMGPAGSGKSAIASQYALTAASQGQRVAMFCFDEGLSTLYARTASTGMDIAQHVESGMIRVQQVDPAELSPGEFVEVVRDSVERLETKLVIIDSLNGYMQAMPEEQFLTAQLHELLTYLRQQNVLTIMIVAQHGFLGQMGAPLDVSYLADTVILTRYFESSGRVRKAISVVKKRSGAHEDSIREFALSSKGLWVGAPLAQFRGVLTGVPAMDGTHGQTAM